MQLDARFVINNDNEMRIVVPDASDKKTYFSEFTPELHRCDEALTRYIGKNYCLDLHREPLGNTLYAMYQKLVKVLYVPNTVPECISVGAVGKEVSKVFNDVHADESIIHDCVVWDHCLSIVTLLYSVNGEIYLEIGPTYPWSFHSVNTIEKYMYYPFEVYLNTYTPYLCIPLSADTVFQWKHHVFTVLASLVSGYRDDMLCEESKYLS